MPDPAFILESDTQHGVPIGEAATRLGLTDNAVRKRIRRRTLRAYKVAGEWRVILPPARSHGQVRGQAANLPGGQATDLSGDLPDGQAADQARDQAGGASQVVAILQDEVAFLRRELETRTEEALAQRQMVLPPGSAEPAAPGDSSAMPPPSPRRAWWQWWRW